MLFSSLTFLFLFLPLVVFIYYLSNNRTYRNLVLLVFSLIFYGFGEPKLILLMIFELLLNYFLTLYMSKCKGRKRRNFLILIIACNILALLYFKYFNFMVANFNFVFSTDFKSNGVLPIGISFYLFQIMSYVIDVYRQEVKVQKSFLLLATYISLFPQLIAGPIVRYETIEDQLNNRFESVDQLYSGFRRFLIGLIKKVVIANNVALVANLAFVDTALGDLNFTLAWIGAIAYTLQIYFDFSGYSDMAIGLGEMFGFHFLENFNYPYTAISITDFWRRWHISLSSWFKDYLYIPLGGNRQGIRKQIRNILIVWALTGLWHGAAWNFIAWGLYFAFVLIMEKLFLLKILERLPKVIRWLYSILIIIVSWVIFNSSSIHQIYYFLLNMFVKIEIPRLLYLKELRILYLWPYFLMALIASSPLIRNVEIKHNKGIFTKFSFNVLLLFFFVYALMLLINNSYNPFIYFRF